MKPLTDKATIDAISKALYEKFAWRTSDVISDMYLAAGLNADGSVPPVERVGWLVESKNEDGDWWVVYDEHTATVHHKAGRTVTRVRLVPVEEP